VVTGLRAARSGGPIAAEKRNLYEDVQTDSGASKPRIQYVLASLPGVKRPGRDDH